MIDAAIHREWLVSLGRRTALARIAHFFCEMQARLTVVGLADPEAASRSRSPQADLAECLGLTSVHVNRTLKELRKPGWPLSRSAGGNPGFPGLKRLAEFDPDYLQLERRPR